ncbi:MAG: hypothetical protein ACI87W_002775 [Halieaceae bacterium]|jgi:hypothetical protein
MTITQQQSRGPNEPANKRSTMSYRMIMDKHTYPYEIKVRDLLECEGFVVEDFHLSTSEETDAFRAEHNVKATSQTWINRNRIGVIQKLLAKAAALGLEWPLPHGGYAQFPSVPDARLVGDPPGTETLGHDQAAAVGGIHPILSEPLLRLLPVLRTLPALVQSRPTRH